MNTAILCILSIALVALPFADSAAYCTYHNYNAGDSLTTVACSDGANGIMTKLKYTNISPMFPYVTAFSGATWNSPKCGTCVRLTSGGRTVHLTVIDQCGPAPAGYDAHFDIAPPAFRELFGDAGVNAGVQRADWSFVDSGNCRGNKGGNIPKPAPKPAPKPGPKPAPKPAPKPSGKSSTRCGASWGDANGKCGIPCTTDGPCKGQKCYADLSMGPCNRATEGDDSTFFADSNVEFVTEFNDAAVADTFETTEGEYFADSAVADAAVADTFETTEGEYFPDSDVDAAVADTFETTEGEFFVDSAVADAAVADTFETTEGEYFPDSDVDAAVSDNFETTEGEYFPDSDVDAAVAGEISSVNTQQTQNEASTGMQGWMVAILVMFSMTTVLLLAVVIVAVTVLRRH